MKEVPAPTNKDELRSFLGVSDYYARFVNGYATLMEPLKKKESFSWGTLEQNVFQEIKNYPMFLLLSLM